MTIGDRFVKSERAWPEVLDIKQCSDFLGQSERKTWDMVQSGEIPHFRARKSIRFHLPALRKWIAVSAATRLRPVSSRCGC